MPLNTVTVACTTAAAIVSTSLRHLCSCRYIGHRNGSDHDGDGGGDGSEEGGDEDFELSYCQGVSLIRAFLTHASHHTVEELQAFTALRVPTPPWVRTEAAVVPVECLARAEELLRAQLADDGSSRLAHGKWWLWREKELAAEWVELRRSPAREEEKEEKEEEKRRTMLYVHGGAYFFGSVDEHRYQLQRHARNLRARVFARTAPLSCCYCNCNCSYYCCCYFCYYCYFCSHRFCNYCCLNADSGSTARYRLAPQFPFPCGVSA